MKKTRRSNKPLKKQHWKAARAARRARLARGDADWRDADRFYRRTKAWAAREHGRAVIDYEGNHVNVGWNTADKSHLKWKLKQHEKQVPAERWDELRARLNLKF